MMHVQPAHRLRDLRPERSLPGRTTAVACVALVLSLAIGAESSTASDFGAESTTASNLGSASELPSRSAAAAVCSPAWLGSGLDNIVGPTTGVPGAASQVGQTVWHPGGSLPSDSDRWNATVDDIEQDPSARYPNDPWFRLYQRRSLLLMGALDAWDTSRGSSDITVAVISTGVQYDHPDLAAKIWRNADEIPGNGIDDDRNGYVDDVHGWNFPAESNDPTDIPRGRGTMMAGIIGAETNNHEGIAGASWGATIMPLKTLVLLDDDNGRRAVGTVHDIVEAVCYAANNGAQVIVFGGYLNDPDRVAEDVQRLQQAIRYAYDVAGAVLVASAGDCYEEQDYCPPPVYGENPPIFPAAFEQEVIGAQSFGLDYRERDEASAGYWVDISAPGEGFLSTISGDPPYVEIKPQPATSDFAAAHIAGVLAVMRSVNPTASQVQLEDLLCRTADRPRGVEFEYVDGRPHNDKWGCGYVNFDHVLDELEPLMRIAPTSLRQFTDGTKPWPRLVFENPYLRASRWIVTPLDALWLTPEEVVDGADGVSRAFLGADLDKLEAELGGLPPPNGRPVTARLRACPLGAHAENEQLCRDLSYELTFVEQVARVHLPIGLRASPFGSSATMPLR